MLYVSVAEVQAQLEDAPADPDLIEPYVVRASDIVRSALRAMLRDPSFEFVPNPVTTMRVVTGLPLPTLTLEAHVIGSISLIEQRLHGAWQPLAATAWLEDARGVLHAEAVWDGYWAISWTDHALYRITAIWGYGDVPPAVADVALQLTINLYRSRSTGGMIDSVGVQGQGMTRVVAGLTKQQLAILESVVAPWQA